MIGQDNWLINVLMTTIYPFLSSGWEEFFFRSHDFSSVNSDNTKNNYEKKTARFFATFSHFYVLLQQSAS